jgi:hypothetical protein
VFVDRQFLVWKDREKEKLYFLLEKKKEVLKKTKKNKKNKTEM